MTSVMSGPQSMHNPSQQGGHGIGRNMHAIWQPIITDRATAYSKLDHLSLAKRSMSTTAVSLIERLARTILTASFTALLKSLNHETLSII